MARTLANSISYSLVTERGTTGIVRSNTFVDLNLAMMQLPVSRKVTTVRSFAGIDIDISGDRWRVGPDHEVELSCFAFEPIIDRAVRRYLENLLRNNAPHYVQNCSRWLKYLGEPAMRTVVREGLQADGSITIATFTMLSRIISGGVANRAGIKSAFIRWYLWCCDSGMDGFDEEVATELDRLVITGVPGGQAVLSLDVDSGPLTQFEVQHVLAKLRGAIHDGGVPVTDLGLAWLLVCFGTNSKNVRLLREEDLSRHVASDGTEIFEIRIPRIKKRASKERAAFRTRTLEPEIGHLLMNVISANLEAHPPHKNTYVAKSGTRAQYARPLFRTREIRTELLDTPFEEEAFRMRDVEPTQALKRIVTALGLKNREGGRLDLYPRRLRYTLAKRMVGNGASPREVADALDHSTTDHVMVYFNAGFELIKKIDRTIGPVLLPHAQAFMGRVVRGPEDAERGEDPASLIAMVSPTMESLRKLGTCGEHGECSLYAPIACYTCRVFQPWLEADHRALLDSLIATRDARLERGADSKWTQVNDRTIQAIMEVADRCDNILAVEKEI
jgi:hypothetical protein